MAKMVYVKVEPKVVKENRKFFKNHVKNSFVRWCAYKGYFDGIFTRQEIYNAKRGGSLPKDCDIHHIMPLSGCENTSVNDFSNLAVVHKNTHKHINKMVFQPQLHGIEKEPYGTTRVIDIPTYHYVDREGIARERGAVKKCLTNSKSML